MPYCGDCDGPQALAVSRYCCPALAIPCRPTSREAKESGAMMRVTALTVSGRNHLLSAALPQLRAAIRLGPWVLRTASGA